MKNSASEFDDYHIKNCFFLAFTFRFVFFLSESFFFSGNDAVCKIDFFADISRYNRFFLDIMLYKSVLKKESSVRITDFLKTILQKF